MDTGRKVPQRSLQLTSPLPLILIALLLFLQLTNPSTAWSWPLAGLVAMLVIAYVWARQMRDRVVASRELRGTWVVVGDVLQEHFRLQNDSFLPILWAEVVDASNVPGYNANRVETASAHDTRHWRMSGVCQRRGLFTLGPWELHLGDPLGFFRVVHHYPDTHALLVYPRVMHLPALNLPRGAAEGPSRTSQRSVEQTIAASNVRDYAPGDALRLVHWRITAHHDSLMVREFDLEPSGNLWIVLDLDRRVQAGEGQESTEEYGVILAASLAAEMLRQNRAVGLVAFGQEPAFVLPQRGQAQLWRLLHLLAGVSTGTDWPLARALEEISPMLGRGRTLVIITPSLESDWIAPLLPLMRRDISPAAILLDRASFDGPDTDSVTALRGLLAEQGVPSYIIRKGFPFRPLVRYKRRRPVYRVLSATGRVIAMEVEEEV
ncbi:MAG: DUF58 domain-containing protein [Anaerolineae bacterium]|jgi:uncharacterized protein (DUF58 family)|nr:DUF58 domain-containing protein [Anaerolineae bacterium]MDH7475598.1 DUF58 domain-containing protein [Anaerolineae bacterium]